MDVAQLKRIPLFADAPDEELQSVAFFAESKEVPEGTVLIDEDGFANAFDGDRGRHRRGQPRRGAGR